MYHALSGGTRGIGRECALALARQGNLLYSYLLYKEININYKVVRFVLRRKAYVDHFHLDVRYVAQVTEKPVGPQPKFYSVIW